MKMISSLASLKISGRLNAGFATISAILAVAIGISLWMVGGIADRTVRIVDLRVPTSNASLGMVNGVNASLAALRGWMITGNPAFKAGRAATWVEMDTIRTDMDRLSTSWTNPDNVRKWTDFKAVLDEFREAQAKVENVANSPDETPATKVLVNEAAPKAAVMVGEITNIINIEATLPATPERKALLGMMADVRGTTARGLANIRAFLLTGDQKFHVRFNTMWTKNKRRFADLKANRHMFNPAQEAAFAKLDAARTAFLPLPDRMFSIRGSNKWNMANYLLVSEAAPRAGKLLTTLLGPKTDGGSRAGGMVANQKKLLTDDANAAASEVTLLKSIEWILLVAGVLIASVVAIITSRSIVKPIGAITGAMTRLAGGEKSVEVPATERTDEIGDMAQALLTFKESAQEAERLAEQTAQMEREQAEERERANQAAADEERRKGEEAAEQQRKTQERAAMIEEITSRFDGEVSTVFQSVEQAASRMGLTAEAMSSTAEQTKQQSTAVAAATEEAAANVQTVAAAAEELSNSVAEISRQASQSGEIAQNAVSEAERVNAKVQGLNEAAQKIGDVVNLINDIASQTNLLALNATIEAARAGDAGKGFAVVASEVKSLADQTAKATQEIGEQIGDIQSATEEAVAAIGSIGKTIDQTSEIATAISSAVEEQGAATQEIAGNAQQAAAGTEEVSSNITGVNTAAEETGRSAADVLAASGEMTRQSETLRASVDQFLSDIKAA